MAAADWATLMKTESVKEKKWRWEKQGMTVNDIKGLFWSIDERLIMTNAWSDRVLLILHMPAQAYRHVESYKTISLFDTLNILE